MWNKNYKNCISCHSTLFPYKGKGMCNKCYRVNAQINALDHMSESELQNRLLTSCLFEDRKNFNEKTMKNKIDVIKNSLERKLYYIRKYGSIEHNNLKVNILELEEIFNAVAKRAGKSSSFYTQDLLLFDTRFSHEQRKIIALKLLKLLIRK